MQCLCDKDSALFIFLKNDFGEEIVFKGEDSWDGGGGVERYLEQEIHLSIFPKDLVCSSSVPFFISIE